MSGSGTFWLDRKADKSRSHRCSVQASKNNSQYFCRVSLTAFPKYNTRQHSLQVLICFRGTTKHKRCRQRAFTIMDSNLYLCWLLIHSPEQAISFECWYAVHWITFTRTSFFLFHVLQRVLIASLHAYHQFRPSGCHTDLNTR